MNDNNAIQRSGKSDILVIANLMEEYFTGLFNGDTERLERIFHPDAILKSPEGRLGLKEWLQAVAARPIPRDAHPRTGFEISSIELVKNQAIAKVICPLFEHNYIDFLGLLKEGGTWRIVNKMYTDVGTEHDQFKN